MKKKWENIKKRGENTYAKTKINYDTTQKRNNIKREGRSLYKRREF